MSNVTAPVAVIRRNFEGRAQWGVSLDGSHDNPSQDNIIICSDEDNAIRLAQVLVAYEAEVRRPPKLVLPAGKIVAFGDRQFVLQNETVVVEHEASVGLVGSRAHETAYEAYEAACRMAGIPK